jgi:DNA-binding response OmpR family regulator
MQVTPSTEKKKILLVEDDTNLGFLLVEYLESQGFEVKLYRDGESCLRGFQSGSYDMCIVDIMLPKIDGFSLLEKIKSINKDVPAMILSSRSMKEDKIKGFRLGVDDYVTKPFDEDELLYRIKAILNRAAQSPFSSQSNKEPVKFGVFVFDCANQILKSETSSQRLTHKETMILNILACSLNNLVKREEIMISVWGESDYFTGRSLDVFISKIRNYLKDDPSIKLVTIPTVGYVLEVDVNH